MYLGVGILKIGNPKKQNNNEITIPECAKILSLKNLFKTGVVDGILEIAEMGDVSWYHQ